MTTYLIIGAIAIIVLIILFSETETDAQAAYIKECKEAESRLFIEKKNAEAVKAKAEAEKFKKEQEAAAVKAMAEAEAARIAMEGEAEANVIKLKGEAEANALQKKAEAFEKYGNAAILDMVVKILPEMAANVASPISAIKDVRIYGSDGNGIQSMANNVPSVMKQTLDTLESIGVPVKGMLDAKTKSAMTDKNIGMGVTLDDSTKPLYS